MNTARLVRRLNDWDSDAALYRLSPPLVIAGERVDHVVVSTAVPINGDHGSLIFAASADGTVTSWSDLARNDVQSHAEALAGIGYEVAS